MNSSSLEDYFRSVMHPAGYHGHLFGSPYFEGWYYKIVSADGSRRLAIIPGMFRAAMPQSSLCFVQILDSTNRRTSFRSFRIDQFDAATDGNLAIAIANNHFTDKSITLDIQADTLSISGTVGFNSLSPWPVKIWSPGIMGWYAWVPSMECYHGIVSMDHSLSGTLRINGECIDFNDGRGYIEKDWGSSFPSSWVWMQGNHFETPGTSISASLAVIPWKKSAFPGFIVGLLHQNRLYRFTTYNYSKIKHLEVTDSQVYWVLQKRRFRLEITCTRADTVPLQAPTTSGMNRIIPETLESRIDLVLKESGRTILESSSPYCGLEVVDQQELLASI